jgi:hypothetical protein
MVYRDRSVQRWDTTDIGYFLFGFLNTDKGTIYKEIVASDIDEITGQYSLHHCIAGRDREVLRTPINLQL